jgi:nucleotide-binding universal stress UspA family protein
MKFISKILVPTDLSETSQHGIVYGCGLAEEQKASLIVLHVANEVEAWEPFSEDYGIGHFTGAKWSADRVISEAMLDLNRFLEPHLEKVKSLPLVSKRVVLGRVAQEIARVAADEKADLVVLSPRRQRGLRHWLTGGITNRVTRISPCPVLSVAPRLASLSWRGRLVSANFDWPRQTAKSL